MCAALWIWTLLRSMLWTEVAGREYKDIGKVFSKYTSWHEGARG